MAFIEIHPELSKLTKTLERIAEALERAFPPMEYDKDLVSTDKDLYTIDYQGSGSKSEDTLWEDYGPRRNY